MMVLVIPLSLSLSPLSLSWFKVEGLWGGWMNGGDVLGKGNKFGVPRNPKPRSPLKSRAADSSFYATFRVVRNVDVRAGLIYQGGKEGGVTGRERALQQQVT